VQHLALAREGLLQFGRDFEALQVLVEAQTEQRLHIKIFPPGHKRCAACRLHALPCPQRTCHVS
jgi:hypothetical protein